MANKYYHTQVTLMKMAFMFTSLNVLCPTRRRYLKRVLKIAFNCYEAGIKLLKFS